MSSSDPNPWFSHQNYPHYLDRSTLVLFDNGKTRRASDPSAHSRGQVWRLDEDTLTATLVLNVDVELLRLAGDRRADAERELRLRLGIPGPLGSQIGQSIEVLPDGTKTYVQEVAARDYRSFRMRSLYRGIHH